MSMKKILTFLICSVFVISGCARNVDYVAQSQKYPWVLAHASTTDTITSIFADKFAEEVEELSDGRMQIEVYDNSTLGGDRELIESCLTKDVKFIVQNTAPQVPFMEQLAVFDLPMAYDEINDVREVLDDPNFRSIIDGIYKDAGFKLLSFADQDFRVMTTNKEIRSIDDFAGQKIRTMENSYHLMFWQNIHANPTPMSFSEVYIGLQQKTIDAQENPVEVIVSSNLYEQQKYIVETNHLPHLLSLITNNDFYKSLSKEDQEIIDQASENASEYAREQSDQRIEDRINICLENGVNILELDDETKEQMRELNDGLYEDIKNEVGEELYNAYLKNAEWR